MVRGLIVLTSHRQVLVVAVVETCMMREVMEPILSMLQVVKEGS